MGSQEIKNDGVALQVAIPQQSSASASTVKSGLNQLLTPAANLSLATPTVEDASAVILKMQLPSYNSIGEYSGINSYTRDLLQIGKQRGFTIQITGEPCEVKDKIKQDLIDIDGVSEAESSLLVDRYLDVVNLQENVSPYLEDTKIIFGSGEVLKPALLSQDVFNSVQKYLAPRPDMTPETSGYSYLSIDSSDGSTVLDIMGVPSQREGWMDEADIFSLANNPGQGVKSARAYFEGGNALFGLHKNGEKYGIIGEHTAVFAAFLLREEGAVELNRKTRSGKIEQLLAQPQQLEEKISDVQARLESLTGKSTNRREALQFIADLEIAKDVIAKDLNLDRDNLTFIEQPGFHIDMHILPLTPGKVAVNSYQECAKFLTQAIKRLEPDTREYSLLSSMLSEAEAKIATLDPVNDRIVAQLEKAGFEVVKAPGVFYGSVDYKDINFNFMNGIPGTDEQSGRCYLITNAPGIEVVESQFEDFISQHGISDVDWVGGPRKGRDFTISDSIELLRNASGISCIQAAITK